MSFRKIMSGVSAVAIVFTFGMVSLPTDGWAQLEEMIVSVRKRDELLQNVPISINVLSADQIMRFNLDDIKDVAQYSSSLIYNQGFFPNDNRIIIRGVRNTRGRPSAAFLIDGIDVTSQSISQRGNSMLATTRLLDVERVEVILGPQSALYGRTAFGGAVQYISKDPSDEYEGHADVDIGNYGRYDVSGGVSGPVIAGVLGISLNGNYWDEKGFYKNRVRLFDLGGGGGWGMAGTVKWDPNDRWSFKARAEYTEDDFDEIARVVLPFNAVRSLLDSPDTIAATLPPLSLSDSPRPFFVGTIPDNAGGLMPKLTSPDPLTDKRYQGSWRDVLRVSLVAEWDLDFGTISSWSSYAEAESGFVKDGSNTSIGFGEPGMMTLTQLAAQRSSANTDTMQLSQEFRFASDWDGPVQFTLGGLYFQEKVDRVNQNISLGSFCRDNDGARGSSGDLCEFGAFGFEGDGAPFKAVQVTPSFLQRNIWSVSGYGLLEWEITEQWKITAEARYSDEDEHAWGWECDVFATWAAYSGGVEPGRGGTNFFGEAFADTPPEFICPRGPSNVLVRDPTFDDPAVQAVGRPRLEKHNEKFWTPRYTLEWTVDDDTLLFFSAAKAVKPGGTNAAVSGTWFDITFDGSIDENKFDRETLWSYELGVKKMWLDHTLRTNASLFYQNYKGRQVSTQQPDCCGSSTSLILNAGVSEIFGFELDTLWQANEHWTFSVGYTWLDTEYTEFTFLNQSESTIIEVGNCEPTFVPAEGITPAFDTCLVSLTGNRLEQIPEHNFVGRAMYTAPLLNTGLNWFFEADGFYTSDRWVDEFNAIRLQPYGLLNLRAGINAGDDWEILFYADNVLDNDTIIGADDVSIGVERELFNAISGERSQAPAGVVMAFLPDPFTFGVRARASF